MGDIQAILAICGGISVIGGAGAVIFKIIRPALKINERVSELERRDAKDFKVLQQLVESNKTQNRLLLSLINHTIDGNGVEQMKNIRNELQDELTK